MGNSHTIVKPNPIAIICDPKYSDTLDILVAMKTLSGKNVIVPVTIGNEYMNNKEILALKIKSVHGNKQAIARLADAIQNDSPTNNRLFFIDKNKTISLFGNILSKQLRANITIPDGLIHKVNDSGSPVKGKFTNINNAKNYRFSKQNYEQMYFDQQRQFAEKVQAIRDKEIALSKKSLKEKLKHNSLTMGNSHTIVKLNGETYILLRKTTPNILIEHARKYVDNVENYPMIMAVKKVQQALEEDDGNNYGPRPHNYTIDSFVELIKGINNPNYIVFQEYNKRFGMVVKFYDGEKKHNAVAVVEFGNSKEPTLLNGYEGGVYNISVTTYDPDSLDKIFKQRRSLNYI